MTTPNQPTAAQRLESLKNQADLLGISYSPNIGEEKLLERIKEKMRENSEKLEQKNKDEDDAAAIGITAQEMKAEKLTRIILTPHDPCYIQRDGVYITVGNSVFPTTSFMVPFGTPWLVPQIVLNQLQSMEYRHYRAKRERNRRINLEQEVEGVWQKAFAVEILDMITDAEIKAIAARQVLGKETQ